MIRLSTFEAKYNVIFMVFSPSDLITEGLTRLLEIETPNSFRVFSRSSTNSNPLGSILSVLLMESDGG